jgi:hypothetical protein
MKPPAYHRDVDDLSAKMIGILYVVQGVRLSSGSRRGGYGCRAEPALLPEMKSAHPRRHALSAKEPDVGRLADDVAIHCFQEIGAR